MALEKKFSWIAGSDIDKVSGVAGTRTGNYKDDTDMGIVLDNLLGDSKVVFTGGDTPSGSYTLVFAVYISSLEGERQPIGIDTGSGFQLYELNGSGNLVWLFGDSISSSVSDKVGDWVIYILESNATTNSRKIYRNNNQVASGGIHTNLSNGDIYVGRRNIGATNFWKGYNAYVQLIDETLTAQERLQLYKDFQRQLRTGRKGLKKSNLLDREIYRHKPTKDIDPSVIAHWSFKNSLLDIAGSNHITGTNWIPTTIGGFFNNNGSGASLNLVTPVLGIQLCKIVKTTDYLFAINATSAITVVGGTITLSGELTAGTVYVDGVASTTIPTTSKMYDIQLSFPAPVTADSFTLNKVGTNYSNAEWIDLKFLSVAPTTQKIKDYHNQFANLLICQDASVGEAVGNAPREWQKGTATTLTQQEITNSCNLPVGTKYVKVTTNQTCYLENDDMASLADNGYAKYWYYTAATNQFEYIEELISASTNLSYASGRLTFTAAADGDGFANDKRYSFVVQAGVIV